MLHAHIAIDEKIPLQDACNGINIALELYRGA
jgi:hypothetical protein